jgi:hypothetical protein
MLNRNGCGKDNVLFYTTTLSCNLSGGSEEHHKSASIPYRYPKYDNSSTNLFIDVRGIPTLLCPVAVI